MQIDESDNKMRRAVIILFKTLCNHLVYIQVISPSLASIAAAERDHKAKIQRLSRDSLMKQLWVHYTTLAKEYRELKNHWSAMKNIKCMEVSFMFWFGWILTHEQCS